jgi:predicted esterase
LHGTGADEHDLLRLGSALDSKAALLSPRGMYLESGMNRFFERYPDGTFNEESVRWAVQELSEFLLAASAEYEIDLSQLVAVGFSNGANTAAAMLTTHPDMVSMAVLFGSTRPLKEVSSDLDLTGKRVWIANGDLDPYAPVEVTESWVETLSSRGAQVQWLRHPGGHQISPAHLQEISSQLN